MIEGLASALKNLYAYKMRSVLTMLGIIIGISSVIMITSLGDGVYQAIQGELGSFNTTSVQVLPRNMMGPPTLNMEDAEAIAMLHNVTGVTGMLELWGQNMTLRNPNETRRGSGWGVDQNYHEIEAVNMRYGRFITEQDVQTSARVAVISPQTSLDVFGFIDSVGHALEIQGNLGRYRLTVVGILDINPGELMMAQTPLNMGMFVLPITTAGQLRGIEGYMDNISVSLEEPLLSMATAEQITRLLNARHDLEDGFLVMSMAEVMEGLDIIFLGVTGFIAFVAGISLFVGGVGVMNIMMVTVTERTKEIGIRKSLGATGGIIRLQFVFEAVALTTIGGIIGIIFGMGSAMGLVALVNSVSPMELGITIDGMAITIALVVSTSVGVIFGVYPAGKAAKLDPVDSLRYE